MSDEGMKAAAEFARFSAQLDDTFKVVSKPKEWQPSDQTAAHYPRWAFLMRANFSLIHPDMQEWLRVVEGTATEGEVDIKRMSPTEKLYSRVVYNILVQVLSRGHCSTIAGCCGSGSTPASAWVCGTGSGCCTSHRCTTRRASTCCY